MKLFEINISVHLILKEGGVVKCFRKVRTVRRLDSSLYYRQFVSVYSKFDTDIAMQSNLV